ncbi:hypothetical protein [Mangrovimonas spongiae]|uniref:Uncharacterized protein n=1 Tax=Mangrovimonas spongiae TaxID=2494697 RepID=A0A3R9PKF4_9FLAO|nr:hypothetical protein [Mangrovimonas spongiae]RSK40322.1 hypothetical protein EJA19_04910 [Mangrovimonas spongiae]
MKLETYFDHDSDDQIIQKRSENELTLWVNHVSYIIEESDRLAKIASNLLKESVLRDRFLIMIERAIVVSKVLSNYKKAMPNYKECDHLECDLYYINEHEKVRQEYLKIIKDNRELKEEFYTQLLK